MRFTLSGEVVLLHQLSEAEKLNVVQIREPINTHRHGREYHNRVGRIGLEIGMEYSYMNTIIGKLFGDRFDYHAKLLSLTTRELYCFVINNMDTLRRGVRAAMAIDLQQASLELDTVSEKEFEFSQTLRFTYNPNNKIQEEYSKNVYQGYLSSAEPRSFPETMFEKFCENSNSVDWFYKNGDKGDEYLSIVYLDNSNKQKLFYPDYVVSIKGEIWVIETKGGFDRSGASEDIDIFSAKKFSVLKKYLHKHNLKGGFVRYDKRSADLFICTEDYNDDLNSEAWTLLRKTV